MDDLGLLDAQAAPIQYGNRSVALDLPRIKDIRLSYSTNSTFESCNRRFELTRLFYQPERGPWEDNHAADVGKALHAAYQHYIATQDEVESFFILAREYPHESSIGWNDQRSLETTVGLLELMIEQASTHEFELARIKHPATGEIVPATEVSFEIEFVTPAGGPVLVNGGRLTFVGYIDVIEVSRFTARFRVSDIKTHGSKIQDRNPVYKFNTQMIPYGIVLEHIQGAPIDEFQVDYLDCYVDLVAPRVQHYCYTKSQVDIQEWIAARVVQIRRLNMMLQTGFFPRSENGCTTFNKPCRFLDVCETRDPNAVQAYLLLGEEPQIPQTFDAMIRLKLEIPEEML